MGSLRTHVGAIALGALLVLVGLGRAEAQTQEARNRARALYESAQRLFDAGNFAAAESTFRAAYEAVPNPVVLRAIAASQERQGNLGAAAQTLEQYLRESPTASDRAEVERHLAELRSRPATLSVGSTPPGAEIVVDGRPTGQHTPADVSLPAGEHTIELRLAGHQAVQQSVNAMPATRMRMDVNLPAAAGGGGDPLGGQGGGSAAGGGGGGGGGSADPSVGVWITAGIAAAGLVSGTVFGFLALSEQSNFDNMPTHDTADRGEVFALVADISFGVAAAAAITAIVLYIVERSSGGGTEQASLLDSDDLRLELGAFGDPNGGGVAARLRF